MTNKELEELIKWNRFAGQSSTIKPELKKRFQETVSALEELLAYRMTTSKV